MIKECSVKEFFTLLLVHSAFKVTVQCVWQFFHFMLSFCVREFVHFMLTFCVQGPVGVFAQ